MNDLAKLALRAEQYSSRTSLKRAGLSLSRWLIALASRVVASTPDVETSKDLEKIVVGFLFYMLFSFSFFLQSTT
jgi:hypothetical protein